MQDGEQEAGKQVGLGYRTPAPGNKPLRQATLYQPAKDNFFEQRINQRQQEKYLGA